MDLRSFIDRAGTIILAVSIVALLGAFAYSCFLVSKKSIEHVEVQFIMPVDSTGTITDQSMQTAESLRAELVRHEQLLEDRYKHVLEQKENMNDLLSIGGMFLAVVLAIFGFFGYRSMSTIEERVKSYAVTTAENATKEKLDDLKEKAVKSVDSSVKESFGKAFATHKKASKKYIEEQLKMADTKNAQSISELQASLDDTSNSLGNLDEKLSKLDERILKLERETGVREQIRRILTDRGKTE